jgi:glucosylceramidase
MKAKTYPLRMALGVTCLGFLLGNIPAPGAPAFFGQGADMYLTSRDTTNRLAKTRHLQFAESPPPGEKRVCLVIDPTKTFQTVLGIGGALTDASAETFYKLPVARQQEILQAYFDPTNGIGYTLGRTHIHSCDFSSESYTYTSDYDTNLDTFSVAHDLKYRIPFIKAALAKAGKNFTLFASPWSPPAWMKDNHSMLHGGKLKREFYGPWANYLAKFIKVYAQNGIPIWGLTVQNEPMANQSWESCIYSPWEERDFVKNNLGPTLQQAGLGDKKIIVWDHNRNFMFQWASVILDDPDAAKYVWGVGYHWYVEDNFENVKKVAEAFPHAHLLFTEGCNGPYDVTKINAWPGGEAYGQSMIEDFNNGAEGWTDWNVLLDEKGGPNHVQNYCFAPIHADTATGTLTYMNSYFYIGHFSKFIRPGARRISSSSTTEKLPVAAFVNTDGSTVVVILNATAVAQPFSLWAGTQSAET